MFILIVSAQIASDDALCSVQCFRAALSAVRQDETEALQASGAMAHPVFKNHGMGKNVCAAMFNRLYAFNIFSVHISAFHFIIFAVSLIVCFPCLLFVVSPECSLRAFRFCGLLAKKVDSR